MTDFLDPNNWLVNNHEFRIYADDRAQQWAVVDEIDYQFLIQWKWSIKFSKCGKKFYLRRVVQTGSKLTSRLQQTLFLHTAVMERTGIEKPSPFHNLIDHADGDGLNCRRSNLGWQTHSGNRRNTARYRNHPKRRFTDLLVSP